MDYQTTYNESMTKFADAQKCQDEIIACNKELQQVDNAIRVTGDIQLYYQLKAQRVKLLCKIDEQTKDRDKKLNEALSKALDLVGKDMENRLYYVESKGIEALAIILSYMSVNYIKIRYSAEVVLKQERIFNWAAREIELQNFINQLKMLGW